MSNLVENLAEQLTSTTFRLRGFLSALLMLNAAAFLFSPFSLFSMLFLVFQLFMLVVGMRGTLQQNPRLLKLYWVVQFILLIVYLAMMIAALTAVTMVAVHHRRQVADLNDSDPYRTVYTTETEPHMGGEKTLTGDDLDATVQIEVAKENEHTVVTAFFASTAAQAGQLGTVLIMVIPFLLFSFDVYLRAITIVLARRLIMLVEMNESFAESLVEFAEESNQPEHLYVAVPQAIVVGDNVDLMPVYSGKN